ncbi:Sec6-domain-containing protein [Pseudovirgaria hyperparasitica]|uniref:Sec6-domain-containing protein n=1 Tax=Pseudovirgaria hyperparasitica TaxID=470096 RepID=A0A6A6WIL5_9PEZI|nr:Sec6-domain-containing protein [Pseudovirgaria hyperparasitica]KAF2762129.1 Sec6-domain-containing protein [Pseudovirgaria hyperparasitica]
MNDVETVTVKLAELLRHPEDLDKISALKSEFTRKKAAVDTQLKLGLREQLEITQSGMGSITDGQRTINLIKEEMMKIDKLCSDSTQMIRDFPHINLVAQTHRNFAQVETMKRDIDRFEEKLDELEALLQENEQDLDTQPNLLQVHYGLTELRNIKDSAMDQIRSSANTSMELLENLQLNSGYTLQDYFNRLDELIGKFDKHIDYACMSLIEFVQTNNHGMVVRLATIIDAEEKNDKKARALQDAQKEYKELAARFKSIASGPKEVRGYKDRFLHSIEKVCREQMDQANQAFLNEPDRLDKKLRWYFNDLNTVKIGMVTLMPKKWRIMQTYANIYHNTMHDWLISRVDAEDRTNAHLLIIAQWVEKYYAKMKKLGLSEDDLIPHVIDNRSDELVREYRQQIIKSVEEWMDRMASNDKQTFLSRQEGSLSQDENGCFRTKTLPDLWFMLREQLTVAGNSDRTDVAEGVVEAMFRALTARQQLWQNLIDNELQKYSMPTADIEGLQPLQDWIVAIANDQIACIDDGDNTEGSVSYLSRFSRDFTPLVSPQYAQQALATSDSLRDGYIDLGTHCISVFASLIFAVDFKPFLGEFFTQAWYGQKRISQFVLTFQDYLSDYEGVLHPSLRDILVEELADELLVRYLSSVRNKGVKFRRSDPYGDKIRDDLVTAFDFFKQFPAFDVIKQKWRVVDGFLRMLNAEKAELPAVYEQFKIDYWDTSMSWVEAVMRARDDFDRSTLNSVKAKAAEVYAERGPETAPKSHSNKPGRPTKVPHKSSAAVKDSKEAAKKAHSPLSHHEALRKRAMSKKTNDTAPGEDELAQPSPVVHRKLPQSSLSRNVDAQRRKAAHPGQRNRTAAKLRREFPHLKPRTRYIPQSVVKSKWTHLSVSAQDQVKEIFKAAKWPVVASRKDEKHRREAEAILGQLVQRLETRLPNMPFPPKTKELHFDLEKLMERNRLLDGQLTASLHGVKLLEAEIEKEERALSHDRAVSEQLESKAKLAEQKHRQTGAKLHPLLRSSAATGDDDHPESIKVAFSTRINATSIDETDQDLVPLLDQLRNHLESMQANVAPIYGLRNTIAQAHCALTGVLSEHMDSEQFVSLPG